MSYFYDEEAIYQDADIEQAEWESLGRDLDRAEKAGRCTHGSTVGLGGDGKAHYPEAEGLTGDQRRCRDCGRVFEDDEDYASARDEAIYG